MRRRVEKDCPLPSRSFAIWLFTAATGLAGPGMATPVSDLENTARQTFDNLPEIVRVDSVAGKCRGDADSNMFVRYCSSEDRVYLSKAIKDDVKAAYLLGHVLGHAVQVKHGVADVALAMIRANRPRETELRGMVTRQVECIAGVLLARANVPLPDLIQNFGAEPFTGSHWGRTPLSGGPKVSIGLAARQTWLRRGHRTQDFQACANGDMGAELLLEAEKS